MKKFVPLLTLMLSVAASVFALEVEIDGLCYEVITKGNVAKVIKYKNGQHVVIPETIEYEGVTCSVTSIGDRAFYRCGLQSITIPNSVTTIGSDAFDGCDMLSSVTIGNGVKSMDYGAFRTTGSTSVYISDLEAWCRIAFSEYSNPLRDCEHFYINGEEIKDLAIPGSVTSIGEYAFEGCSGFTSLTIPESVTSIGKRAFYYCSGLNSIAIPSSVKSIGESAFQGCARLSSITIPASVKDIGESAFNYCQSLTSVTFPSTVQNIGEFAFYNCKKLTSVHISDLESWCKKSFGNRFSNPLYYAHHLFLDGEEIKDLVIPNSITEIGSHTFEGFSELASITIPNSVTDIGCSAFRECKGLKSVTIPNSVRSIGLSAFQDCSGLSAVTIGNGVSTIYSLAFANCSELANVYCYTENVPDMSAGNYSCTDAFEGSYVEYANLYVPKASKSSYENRAPWSSFGHILAVGEQEQGVDSPLSDTTENQRYYSVGGLQNVTPLKGISIIKRGEKTVKVMIKKR